MFDIKIALYLILLYFAASLRIVGPKEQGCLLLFGKPIRNVPSGLVFVPLWICSLVIETKLVIQDELPTDPEKIYRGNDADPHGRTVPKELRDLGWKPPIRVTFSGRTARSVAQSIPDDDPYDRRLTAEVVPVVRWKISNFRTFLQTIGSVEEARRQMEDACVKAFTEQLTQVSPAVALQQIGFFSGKLEEAIDTLVASWGVDIVNAEIKAINFSRELNAAVQNVVEKERKKAADILEGQGLGGREQAILDGRTNGFKKMKDDLGVDGAAVIGAETARAIAGEGDKSSQRTIIAGSGGFVDLVGTAAAIAKSFSEKEASK
ncbi:MAG: SPFH domain-containing protein [Minisyncoccia bacterium]